MAVSLDGSSLGLHHLAQVARARETVALADAARRRVLAARALVDQVAASGRVAYGVNTGFGNFADLVIPHNELAQLQVNLVRSHSAGVGEPLPTATVRAMMLLRANVLAKGFSGIRLETLELLLHLLNEGVHPVVPRQGSVGASGDLAPLAHLALVLIGEGQATLRDGPRVDGRAALASIGAQPVALAAKEGLALINGTQASGAVLGLALVDAGTLVRTADVVGSMSLDSLRCSVRPADPRIHRARPHAGQIASAANLDRLVAGSGILASHANCGRVQDAYSIRCMPQVHGAARDAIAFVRRTLEIEINSATDNPMVFADEGEIVSGGNFHGAPLGIGADLLAVALAHLATISERRTERLVNPALSGLPGFLTRHGGTNSGLMLAQVTAAALASETKTLAFPASVDTIPTSANKEDHVSMSMAAALKAERAAANARWVLAIELLAAAQALDFLAPLATSRPLARVHALVRAHVPFIETDQVLSGAIETLSQLIEDGLVVGAAEAEIGALP